MENLILIFSGSIIAGLISKKQFSLFLDILFGVMGAWAAYLTISNMNLPLLFSSHIFTYLTVIISSVTIIHLGRVFENPPKKFLIFD